MEQRPAYGRKIEAKHLAAYMPYGLKCQVTDKGKTKIGSLFAVYDNGECAFYDTIESEKGFSEVKPILRPMSLINGELQEYNGLKVNFLRLFAIKAFDYGYNIEQAEKLILERLDEPFKLPYLIFEEMVKHHFDVFGLIDDGLALDIKTLKQ